MEIVILILIFACVLANFILDRLDTIKTMENLDKIDCHGCKFSGRSDPVDPTHKHPVVK